ncbi:MAG TPA: diguanylate cyclase [Xanthobacteraceae bacterium]
MAQLHAKSHKPSQRGKPLLSIRARLIVVALLIITPLIVERVRGLERERAERVQIAQAEVVDLARGGAEAQRSVVYSLRALLQLIAGAYAKNPQPASECNETLTGLAGNMPWIYAVAIIGLDGRVKCTNEPRLMGVDVSDRPYFPKAIHSRGFLISDYLTMRVRDLPTVAATVPILKPDGTVEGIVGAAVNLQWIGDLGAAAAQRPGVSVTLLDGAGTVMATSAENSKLVGHNVADDALARDMLSADDGVTTATGFDGVRRIFAYVRVPWMHARLAVGLDEAVVNRQIDREIRFAYFQLAIVSALVLLVAWFGGEHLVLRPIRSLQQTAARFGRGELQVRAAQRPLIAEFEPLAAAFDDMAAKLAVREEELRIANQHLEELASLDGLTGLANRRGFDRELERRWQHAAEQRRPLALLMVDIDHFKLFNDGYGHVRGDACLSSVAETLSLVTLHDAVLVARYGGEEFAVLVPGFDTARTTVLGEEVRRAVEGLLLTHAETPCGYLTISVGVASLVPDNRQPAADLVEAADNALYAAKRRGRNAVVAHAPLALSATG